MGGFLPRNAEVSNFDSSYCSEVNVARFYVSVHKPLLMNVVKPLYHLEDYVANLFKGERNLFMAGKLHERHS